MTRARVLFPLLGTMACAASSADVTTPAAASTVADTQTPFVARSLPSDIRSSNPVLPWGLTSFGGTMHEGILYVLGGYSGLPHNYSAADQHGELLAFDPTTQAWSVVEETPPVQGLALVSHRTGLVRVGGMRALNPTTKESSKLVSVATVQRFDPARGGWEELPSLPEGRSSLDAAVIGDDLYVVGGWTLHEEDDPKWPQDMLVLSLDDPSGGWTRVDVPFRRRAIAAASADGKLYVLGGMQPNRKLSRSVDVFDPQSGSWSTGPEFPGQGFGMTAIADGGGVLASGADGALHRLAPGAKTWTEAGSLALPRFFHRLIAGENGTWAVGGIRPNASGARVRLVEAISGPEASPSMVSLRIPSPMPSKNRQGRAVVGEEVLFFGGNNSLGQHDFAADNFTSGGYRLNMSTLEWGRIADYPQARQTMSVATDGSEVISFGGFGHDGEVARSHPEVYAYSLTADAWTPRGSLPAPRGRTQFGLARASDAWWVFGGLDYDPSRAKADQFRHELEVLRAPADLSSGFEPAGVSLPEPRRAFAGGVFEGHYVVVGGMREGFQLVDGCSAFEFETKTWESFACPSRPRLSGHLLTVDGQLVLVGGSSPGADGKLQPNSSVELYDAEAKTWSVLEKDLPIEIKHLHVFAWNDRLVAMSAHNDEGMLDVVMLRVEGSASSAVPPKPAAPSKGHPGAH